jgi:hypothetical protein
MRIASVIESVGEARSFETRYGTRVAIVGGGMLGTTLSLRYRQAGRIVTLFDAAERIERRGHAAIATTDRHLLNLITELDLTDEVRWSEAPSFGMRFGALAGGRARIIESLRERARSIDVDVRLGTPVTEIRAGHAGFTVHSGAEIGEFNQVILAVPAAVASELLSPSLPDPERSIIADVNYVGIVTVSFVLARPAGRRYLSRVVRGGDVFTLLDPSALEPTSESRAVVYVNARVIRSPHAFTHKQQPSFASSIPGLSVVNAAHMGSGRNHLDRSAALATRAFRTLCTERIG